MTSALRDSPACFFRRENRHENLHHAEETSSTASGDNRSDPVFDMDSLNRQAIVQGLLGTLHLIVLVFWPAGTFDYWQGWLFLGIDTGPYAHLRHPMYAGAIWLFVGMPLALGSWWSLVLIPPFVAVLLWRLLDEERRPYTTGSVWRGRQPGRASARAFRRRPDTKAPRD